jgi:hypothetical protein
MENLNEKIGGKVHRKFNKYEDSIWQQWMIMSQLDENLDSSVVFALWSLYRKKITMMLSLQLSSEVQKFLVGEISSYGKD